METHRLVPHPETPPDRIDSVEVRLEIDPSDGILMTFVVSDPSSLRLPSRTSAGRGRELWHTTCFELFLKPLAGGGYFEFNFSPSTQWAAYRFERYREGMADMDLPIAPFIERNPDRRGAVIEVDFDLSGVPNVPMRMGLSAVIEEVSGHKSYWALAHPAGQPDFHDDACFVLELPAARRA